MTFQSNNPVGRAVLNHPRASSVVFGVAFALFTFVVAGQAAFTAVNFWSAVLFGGLAGAFWRWRIESYRRGA